ncbi:hypothetical protein AVEN_90216-1, partial [Araneus ventricosus]
SFVDFFTNRFSTVCMPERTRTEGITPNGLGASRMRAIPSEYSNQKTKESAFMTEKKPFSQERQNPITSKYIRNKMAKK